MQLPKPQNRLPESGQALACMATLDLASPHRAAFELLKAQRQQLCGVLQ
jgi:hypothetical protein